MKTSARFLLLLIAALPAQLAASVILLLSTGDTTLDTQTKTLIEGHGHTVTIGNPYTTFTATELSGVNVVLLFPNNNWNTGDMSLAAQTALVNFVNAGGGLVTSEWTNWKTGAGSFATLDAILPVDSTTQYSGGSAITYTQVTPDATLNAGLATAFSFSGDNYAGVESYFTAKSGATVYYSSTGGSGGAGVIGWNSGAGRVIQFSTVAGPLELGNASYGKLVQNAVQWAAIPEPSTALLMLAGLGVLVWLRRARRA